MNRASMPTLKHLSEDDFLHVYEPQEDTWLLCDALLSQKHVVEQLCPAIALEIG